MAPRLPSFCRYYKRPRVVRLVSNKVGLDSLGFWYAVTQFIIFVVVLIYTIGYSIIYQEAYKDYDKVTSDVRGSLVGALRTDFTTAQLDNVDPKDLSVYKRFWDLTKNDDFASEMESSFFVPTNVFITTNQKRGLCSEYVRTEKTCRRHSDCKGDGEMYGVNNHGVRTGRCIVDRRATGSGKGCEVAGWCPVERNISLASSTVAVLEGTKHFQLHISNHVHFSSFGLDWGIRRTYTIKGVVDEAIKNFYKCKPCQTYAYRVSNIFDGLIGEASNKKTTQIPSNIHKKSEKRKSKATLKSSLRHTKSAQVPDRNNLTYHDIAMRGGVINVNIHWSCYMGLLAATSQEYFRQHCLPTITFILMPSHRPEGFKDPRRAGRFVHKPDHNGRGEATTRDLYKTYGIWFRFYVTSDVSRLSLMSTFKVLFVGLCLVKLSDTVFKLLAPRMCCKSILHSPEYKRARYLDIGDEEKADSDNRE